MSYGLRSFPVHAPLMWNELPQNVRLSDSLLLFKSRLKTHLFKLAFEFWLFIYLFIYLMLFI